LVIGGNGGWWKVVIIVKEWLTVTELAEKTNIPDTTVRRYIGKFPDFFTYKGGSRSRRYEGISIKILVRIKNLFDSGFETEQVDAMLRNEFPMVVSGDDKQQEKESNTPALATGEDIAEIKDALKQQQEFNKLLLERLENRDKEYYNKFDQILRMIQEEKQERLEIAATQEQEQQKKGFFAKLFGK
jgi:DNA-binding transcriptional MerR regulator